RRNLAGQLVLEQVNGGVGKVVNVPQLGRTALPVELELHAAAVAVDEEPGPVSRVERPTPAVPGRPVHGLDELTVERPDADAFGNKPVLGDPQPALARDGEPLGVIHMQRVIRPDARRAWAAYRADKLAVGREHLDLMTLAPIAHIDSAMLIEGNALRVFEFDGRAPIRLL